MSSEEKPNDYPDWYPKSTNCGNCRFAVYSSHMAFTARECRRRAPSTFNAFQYRIADLLRDIAWTQRQVNLIETDEEDKFDPVAEEVTEANMYAVWPMVETDDWCGEWERKQ